MKIYEFLIKNSLKFFLGAHLTIFQYWLFYWRKYASLGLDELIMCIDFTLHAVIYVLFHGGGGWGGGWYLLTY